jgi:antitoxin (DNA-binding transcriptional repressor) of toxin-antitoxin stability system
MVRISSMTEATIKASEFKAKCLKLMDEVQRTGRPVIITKNGQPVARLEAVNTPRPRLLGLHKGQVEIIGDIIEPTGEVWEADT